MSIGQQVKRFCTQIGADPLLVQGAGGNVSWKDGDLLWIKASGTWLVEAESKEIFVPVNLAHLQDALAKRDFSVKPELNSNSDLRPSIETLLHALMPHKVVVHLHVVEILAHLVQLRARQNIKSLVGDSVKWIYVDYFKPGADLARAVSEELTNRPYADVVFMGNHGVVVGGCSINEIIAKLDLLISKLKTTSLTLGPAMCPAKHSDDFFSQGYILCADNEIGHFALKPDWEKRLRDEWALYPDHVVFLGAEAIILDRNFSTIELNECARGKPPFIIAIGDGVYENITVTPAQKSQLRCYFDIISRLDSKENICKLNKDQISQLLNWDAENFRKNRP